MLVLNEKSFLDNPEINKDDFIKISLSPDKKLVPDLYDKLPGKSIWVPCKKTIFNDLLNKEDLKSHFGVSEIFKPDLIFLIEKILRMKILSSISLAQKAGQLVIGLEQIKNHLIERSHCLIILAKGARTLENQFLFSSGHVLCFENLFEKKDLEKCSGKNNVKYLGIFSKKFKKTIQVDLNKLKGFIDKN